MSHSKLPFPSDNPKHAKLNELLLAHGFQRDQGFIDALGALYLGERFALTVSVEEDTIILQAFDLEDPIECEYKRQWSSMEFDPEGLPLLEFMIQSMIKGASA